MDSNSKIVHSLHLQGNAQFAGGHLMEAKTVYSKIVELLPIDINAWYMLSTINGQLGDIQMAGECAKRVLDLQPNHCEARINLGNVYLHQGRQEDAIAEYRQVIRTNPDNAVAQSNLGHILNDLGRTDDAIKSYREALRLNPNFAAAHNNLGNIFFNQGDFRQAIDHLSQAIRLAPSFADAHSNLGNVLAELGRMNEALSAYQKALECNPLSCTALNAYGRASLSQDNIDSYVQFYRKHVELSPNPMDARIAFIGILGSDPCVRFDAWLYSELLNCFSVPDADYQPLVPVTAAFLKAKYDIQSLNHDDFPFVLDLIEKIATDEVFLSYLKSTINTDPAIELLLTAVRRHLLHCGYSDKDTADSNIKVIRALAYQGLNNEHVFFVDDDEQHLISKLKDRIEHDVPTRSQPDAGFEADLLVYGMYHNLYSLSCRAHIAGLPWFLWSRGIQPLLERSLLNPLEEERIKGEIESIGAIEDVTSRLVQSQYEENPYPRWISIPKIKQSTLREALRSHINDGTSPAFIDGAVRVLVAGCGTGKHPIQTALSYKNVDVTAVDICKSSLAYAIRMARKYRVDNIRFLQGDILELGTLDTRFHIIECVGVLHHMDDPIKGWRTLTNLLADDGLMYIGLYSELARKSMTAIGDIFKNEHLISDGNNIRAFRNRILKKKMGNNLKNAFDFYSMSGCRDLLFHAKEHRFTLPQIDTALTDLNLSFLSFIFRYGWEKNLYRNRFPQDTTMDNLMLWDEFEHLYPHTFSKMYQFWCRKNPG